MWLFTFDYNPYMHYYNASCKDYGPQSYLNNLLL